MSRLLLDGETIAVDLDPKGNPIAFTWQDGTYLIERVYQHREIDIGWWSDEGVTHRNIFAVITTDGMLCVIYLDHSDGCWHLEKLYD